MVTPCRIRSARTAEARRLTEIALASKSHWAYPEAWIEAWRRDLTITPGFVESDPVVVAVDTADRPIAFYALILDGADTQLEHLWIDPPYIGHGLGRALFAHAAQEARENGAVALLIESDPNAEPFYRRMGAERIGSRRADVCGARRDLPILRVDLLATPRHRGRP